jgi:hypothetical protein
MDDERRSRVTPAYFADQQRGGDAVARLREKVTTSPSAERTAVDAMLPGR